MSHYEREFTLVELIPKQSHARIKRAIIKSGIPEFSIQDLAGEEILGEQPAAQIDARKMEKFSLAPELEPIGYFYYPSQFKSLATAISDWLHEIMQINWRYQMASDIHIEVTKSDFDALVIKNKQLEASEKKYKSLSESLEQKVKEQVAEIEASHRQMYESEKLVSIGQLAAGVAHEINNPIGFIASNINTAKEYLDELSQPLNLLINNYQSICEESNIKPNDLKYLLEDFTELLNECHDGTSRVASIVSDLKSFSNIDHKEMGYVDLSESLQRTARVFETTFDKTVEFLVEIPKLPKTYCGPALINQLTLNLLKNAQQSVSQSGKIRLRCFADENHVVIEVTDNGHGMDEKTIKRATEPFFTTREVGSGTGLGLTVCNDIIRAHDGQMHIKSALDKGTKVSVKLPIRVAGETQ